MKCFFSFLLLFNATLMAGTVRLEIDRYTELRDKTIIDRSFKRKDYSSFFELDINSSSGMYDLITDISGATKGAKTQVQKEVAVAEILTQQINVERYLDLDLSFAAPLPEAYLGGKKFWANIFATANVGAMQSFENQASSLNPTTQVYLKFEYKYGLSTTLFLSDRKKLGVNLYHLSRQDIYTSITFNQIVKNDELFPTEGLGKAERNLALDLSFETTNGDSNFLFEIKELKAISLGDEKSQYGTRPMIHIQFKRPFALSSTDISPIFGIHYRRAYDLGNGLYAGMRLKYSQELPFVFYGKFSNHFLTLIQSIEVLSFRLSYTFKTAWKNPQDDMWVPPLHSINFAFPF